MINKFKKKISTPKALTIILFSTLLVVGFAFIQLQDLGNEESSGVGTDLFEKNDKITEISLKDLKNGENKVGKLIVNKLDFLLILEGECETEKGKVKMEITGIDLSLYADPFGEYVLYYQGKEAVRNDVDYRYMPAYLYRFSYGAKHYVVVKTATGGSGGTWQSYNVYAINNDALKESFTFDENCTYGEKGNYYLLDYENYLYIISYYTARIGMGAYQASTEIRVLDKNGSIKNYFSFDKPPEEVYDFETWVYPEAVSLAEKNEKLYLKIANFKDGIDKYYLLNLGELMESSI